jgi:hypothetical protein
MITVLLLFGGLILVVALVFLVLKTGMKSGRPGQSGEAEVEKQRDQKRGRPVN